MLKQAVGIGIMMILAFAVNVEAQTTGLLAGEQKTGLLKQCMYSTPGGIYTLTVKSHEICPMSVRVENGAIVGQQEPVGFGGGSPEMYMQGGQAAGFDRAFLQDIDQVLQEGEYTDIERFCLTAMAFVGLDDQGRLLEAWTPACKPFLSLPRGQKALKDLGLIR